MEVLESPPGVIVKVLGLGEMVKSGVVEAGARDDGGVEVAGLTDAF